MPKLRIFLWQTPLNALHVRGVLLHRGMMIDPTCPLCGEDIETIDHLFWDCSTTKRVWRLAFQQQWVYLNPNAVRRATFLLWSIWKGRNDLVFQNRQFIPIRVLTCDKKAFAEWEI